MDNRFEDFKTKLDYFEKELKRPHVTKKLLWQEYRSEYSKGYGYTQFCYHLSQHIIARNPTMVLNHKPGEKLYVDFAGDKLSFVKGLLNLQSNGVNGDVINEMIKRNNDVNNKVAQSINSKNPNEMHRPGIYYLIPDNPDNPLKQVNPTVIAGTKSGGFGTALAQNYTAGIAKNKLRSCLSGPKSHFQIDSLQPVFYFYFENNPNPSSDSWYFATATSPNEFTCVILTEKKDEREMVVGSSNAYGSSTGIPNRIKIPFDYEQIADGIYKVTFKEPLDEGEYCFVYASDVPTRFTNNKVFDFGIRIKSNE